MGLRQSGLTYGALMSSQTLYLTLQPGASACTTRLSDGSMHSHSSDRSCHSWIYCWMRRAEELRLQLPSEGEHRCHNPGPVPRWPLWAGRMIKTLGYSPYMYGQWHICMGN